MAENFEETSTMRSRARASAWYNCPTFNSTTDVCACARPETQFLPEVTSDPINVNINNERSVSINGTRNSEVV